MFKKCLPIVFALVVTLTSAQYANADVRGNSYVGWVNLETPTGNVVSFFWDVSFDNATGVWMSANNVPIDGTFYQSGNDVAVQLNIAPFLSHFRARAFGPFLLVESFSDLDGNKLAFPALLYPR